MNNVGAFFNWIYLLSKDLQRRSSPRDRFLASKETDKVWIQVLDVIETKNLWNE